MWYQSRQGFGYRIFNDVQKYKIEEKKHKFKNAKYRKLKKDKITNIQKYKNTRKCNNPRRDKIQK